MKIKSPSSARLSISVGESYERPRPKPAMPALRPWPSKKTHGHLSAQIEAVSDWINGDCTGAQPIVTPELAYIALRYQVLLANAMGRANRENGLITVATEPQSYQIILGRVGEIPIEELPVRG